MKLFATLLLLVSVLWYLAGVAVWTYFLPAVKEQFWFSVGAGSGIFDYCAGLLGGFCLAVVIHRGRL